MAYTHETTSRSFFPFLFLGSGWRSSFFLLSLFYFSFLLLGRERERGNVKGAEMWWVDLILSSYFP